MRRSCAIFAASLALTPVPLAAQTAAGPVLPETLVRGADGSVTVRAVRLETPLDLDGTLDEAIYERVQPASDFIQIEPSPGAPARDQTEFWIMFDDKNVYMAARAWDSDMEIVTTEMRRDNLWNGNDTIGFAFDTFLDRRNSLAFHANALGARHDGQSTNESQWNGDLNPIWEVATGRFDAGWTLEAAIPFKSLRYGPGRQQTWGAPGAATQPVDQRDLVPHRTAARAGPGRVPADVTRRDARGHRSATEFADRRAKAVPELERHDGRAQRRR